MAMPRLNKVITKLESGAPVFGTVVYNGNLHEAAYLSETDYDFVMIEMEHAAALDFPALENTLQHLLSRGRIARKGTVDPDVVPLPRVPTNPRETNRWAIEHALDAGAYGLITPRVSTVDGARAIVAAVRYPRPDEAALLSAAEGKLRRGLRGWGLHKPARYWGLTLDEYYEKAGLWPVDPAGDLCLIGMIETAEGLHNLPEILEQAPGFAGIIVGIDDLAMDLGFGNDINHPGAQRALLQILNICAGHGVACGAVAGAAVIEERVAQGFRILLIPPEHGSAALHLGRAAAARQS